MLLQIDDLEPAYTKYVNAYQGDFDNYPPVQSNPNLLPILQSLPPLSSPSPFHPDDDPSQAPSHPTLDALFSLPLDRLLYFKKLYGKLLKSTQPGKSDHNLLVGANEKLDWLVDMSRESGERRVTDTDGNTPLASAPSAAPASTGSARSSDDQQRQQQQQQQQAPQTPQSAPTQQPSTQLPSASRGHLPHLSSAHSSTSSKTSNHPLNTNLSRPPSDGNTSAASASSVERSSGQTTASNASTALTADSLSGGGASALLDLEKRLDTSRTLDIFTMKPKVRLGSDFLQVIGQYRMLTLCAPVFLAEMQAANESSQSSLPTLGSLSRRCPSLFHSCFLKHTKRGLYSVSGDFPPNRPFPPLRTHTVACYRTAQDESIR